MRSFYAKLSAIFLLLMLIVVVVVSILGFQAALQLETETEQKLNRTLAQDLAVVFQPWLMEKIDDKMIQMEISDMMGLNRRIEIYLMGPDGVIKAHFVPDGQPLPMPHVDLAPLDAYLAGAELPILGDDPLRVGRKKPFTVAPITIMGETGCYLYVILGGERYETVANMLRDSYIVRTSALGIGLTLLVSVIVGMILFALLTKRLRRMRESVKAFERGNLQKRIQPGAADELGELGVAFNQMADTIVANMDQLKQADQLRRELIANVSHDLRSPLASIQGYLETILIKDESLSANERQAYLEVGLKNTRRLGALIESLFELSKLDARQIEPQIEQFSIAELAQDLVMHFRPIAERNRIQLTADVAAPLPLVFADIALVERAISNLIDNALRHTPAGGSVRIIPTNDAGYVRVEVADTGAGIPEADLLRVFDRFYRVEKSRAPEENGGAGLGLAIAQKIVELHGSALHVHSIVNQGTSFDFRLPTRRDLVKRAALQPA
ncbi:MAG: HAMP domain-containing sensor histidine kinase [Rhodothermales bacterium]